MSSRQAIAERKAPREWRSRLQAPRQQQLPVARGHNMPASDVPIEAARPESPALAVSLAATTSTAAPAYAPPELPPHYGEDRAVLLVRDPYWVYAWWELTEALLVRTRTELGEPGCITLRFYDISLIEWNGNNHHHSFDIAVDTALGNWYVDLGRPAASFCAELGLLARDGRFVAMVRTNTVTLPRDSMSPLVDEEWMALDEEYARMFELSGSGHLGMGSHDLRRALEQRLRRLLASGITSFGASGGRRPS